MRKIIIFLLGMFVFLNIQMIHGFAYEKDTFMYLSPEIKFCEESDFTKYLMLDSKMVYVTFSDDVKVTHASYMVNGVSVAVPFEYSYDEERDFRQYTVNSNVCDSFKGFLTEDQIDEMIAFNVKMDNLYFQYNILIEYHFDPVTNTFDSEGHQ